MGYANMILPHLQKAKIDPFNLKFKSQEWVYSMVLLTHVLAIIVISSGLV
jgi:hypothetical protein